LRKIIVNFAVNFQVMIAANDGLFDGPGFDSDESRLMSNCLHLLFRVLLTLFAWYASTSFYHPLWCQNQMQLNSYQRIGLKWALTFEPRVYDDDKL